MDHRLPVLEAEVSDPDASAVPHWYIYPPKHSYTDAQGIGEFEFGLGEAEVTSVYVHVPFCNMRCSFCSLYTSAGYSDDAVQQYASVLAQEVATFRSRSDLGWPRIDTLYFGGGTPAQLGEPALTDVLNALYELGDFTRAHRTVEFSPDVVTPTTVAAWRAHAFDRASLGIQTFDEALLSAMYRKHSVEDARRAVRDLVEAGFDSVNVDLIFGHGGQSLRQWERDLEEVAATEATSCTFHPLAVIPKTDFEKKAVSEAAEAALSSQMHRMALDFFDAQGWTRTSAISYARTARPNPLEYAEARGITTLGFGAGSRSYYPSLHTSTLPSSNRQSFGRVLRAYTESVEAGRRPALALVRLNEEERVRRQLILQMHHGTIGNATLEWTKHVAGTQAIAQDLDDLVNRGLLRRSPDGLDLTKEGAVMAASVGLTLASDKVRRSIRKSSATP